MAPTGAPIPRWSQSGARTPGRPVQRLDGACLPDRVFAAEQRLAGPARGHGEVLELEPVGVRAVGLDALDGAAVAAQLDRALPAEPRVGDEQRALLPQHAEL